MQSDTPSDAAHMPLPNEKTRILARPSDYPGLISFWDFSHRQEDGQWTASEGSQRCTLYEQATAMRRENDSAAPFAEGALRIDEGQWLMCPRRECSELDIHGPTGHFTLVAWIKRQPTRKRNCEFIAGQWNETEKSRQYGLFINIAMWRSSDQVCGHLSTHGGPTPGFRYCADGAIGATPIPFDAWRCVAMSYDAAHGYAWVDGVLDEQPRINPYLLPGGLNDGGPNGSDFTVGAVSRSGEIGNFFHGLLGGLAVYNRVLSPAEMWSLCAPATA